MTELDELRNGALACGSNLLAGIVALICAAAPTLQMLLRSTQTSPPGEGLKNDRGAVLIMQGDGNLVRPRHFTFRII
jgi:hypothetical protein